MNIASSSSNGGSWAQACDLCHSAPSVVYCRSDAAYLCVACEAQVHEANHVASRHERVPVCMACECAPATVTFWADAAALCATCDADVNSANALASRHLRFPSLPLPAGRLPGVALLQTLIGTKLPVEDRKEEGSYAYEDVPWYLINKSCDANNNEIILNNEVDEYLDLSEYKGCGELHYLEQQQQQRLHQNYWKKEDNECLVPSNYSANQHKFQQQQQSYDIDMEYEDTSVGFYPTASLSHTVSFTTMDMGIVSDTMTDISSSHFQSSDGFMDTFPGIPSKMPPQLPALDREARVLRYREKRKTRKFEKMIRYASRKAYAEARPRIKGRFAKISDLELEVDQMFSDSLLSDSSFGHNLSILSLGLCLF